MMDGLKPGDRAPQRYRKFDGTPHWQFDTVFLGADEFGHWVGGRPGDLCERPGWSLAVDVHWVTLVPAHHFVATFNGAGGIMGSEVYVDLMSRPEWCAGEVRAIDLDLDVIRAFTGEVFIDDEDEFAEHQVRFGYPEDLIATVRRTADDLLVAIAERREPFNTVGPGWLAHCRTMLSDAS